MTNDNFLHTDAPAEIEIAGSESRCSYLPRQSATMVYRLAIRLSATRYDALLSRGWRRFGRTLFRPVCSGCQACQSLRVIVPEFQPSKSHRRTLRKNSDVEVLIQRPTVTDEHLELYNSYHLDMHYRRQWPFRRINHDQYYESFLDGNFSFSREFQYRQNGRLIGLGIVDITDTAMSSIYFVHDPEYRDSALGTFSVLCELQEGMRSNRNRLYMGYYIQDCPSMNYKNRYLPYEILQEYVCDSQEPDWQRHS